ncbi:hypothetical protein BGX21_008669 [Mortierella sp. AD011]|nr:hypothetical protein BGX20_007504 [Mortierella sp. AD010]KAF9397615.1 hypothetical protein BGX21_008669 [Mortierella sp. AD011]
MARNPPLTHAESLLVEAYTNILNDPFEDKYEDKWEDEPFDRAIDEFKARAQEIGFSDPFQLLSRYKILSYDAIRTQLKNGPPPCFRPGWKSPFLGTKVDLTSVLAKCEHLSGPKFDSNRRIVVLDFWASWCDPCVQSGPEISKLADEFADSIAVVGINNESIFGVTKPPEVELLQEFLNENRNGFRYTIYIDNAEGYAKETVYNPTGYRGIPCAILLVDGVVRYVGPPQENLRPALEEALKVAEVTAVREE